jgi:hypothetical protein
MEQSNSPVLSCKKFGKSIHVLPDSPILSCGKKRKKPLPDDSPVFLRTVRSNKSSKGRESPVIENFSSPPTKNVSSLPIQKLKPKSLFTDIDDGISAESQVPSSSQKCSIIDEEESHSDDTGSQDDLIIHERTMSDSEDLVAS